MVIANSCYYDYYDPWVHLFIVMVFDDGMKDEDVGKVDDIWFYQLGAVMLFFVWILLGKVTWNDKCFQRGWNHLSENNGKSKITRLDFFDHQSWDRKMFWFK